VNIKLLKNRSDIGAGTRGSDLGIDALEIAAINSNNDFFNRHSYLDIKTHNETIYQKNTNSFAQRIEHVAEQCNRVCDAVETTLNQDFFPIVLSGDHSSALGTISGIKKAYPNNTVVMIKNVISEEKEPEYFFLREFIELKSLKSLPAYRSLMISVTIC
jgi:arginase